MPLGIGGKTVPVDDEGYLVDPGDWNEEIAEKLARQERVMLSDAHWAVIRFVREYYEQHQIIPDARHVMRHLAAYRGGHDEGRNDLFRLFPYGYVKQACKIAGMRRPRAWSTG
ncbi:MAG: TusE/DsrC/DsvC family sulfur relay protein [Betaproteobacteria bacterium]|nr:TusE/DsrC/DsvC family sulfur relay protein [Betaproteobacteria bacterium]